MRAMHGNEKKLKNDVTFSELLRYLNYPIVVLLTGAV